MPWMGFQSMALLTLDDDSISQLDPCNGIYNDNGSYQYHVPRIDQVDGDLEYRVLQHY